MKSDAQNGAVELIETGNDYTEHLETLDVDYYAVTPPVGSLAEAVQAAVDAGRNQRVGRMR